MEPIVEPTPWGLLATVLGLALLICAGLVYRAYRRVLPMAAAVEGEKPLIMKFFIGFNIGAAIAAMLGAALVIVGNTVLGGIGEMSVTVSPSLYYVAALGAMLVFLTYNVLFHRVRSSLENENMAQDEKAERIGRVQGNFIEYASMGAVMLVVLDLAGAHAALVHMCGSVFLFGRVLHAYGFSRAAFHLGRPFGIQITLIGLAAMVFALIFTLMSA